MKNLKSNWEFWCDCNLCSASSERVEESDQRIEKILELQEEIEDETELSDADPWLAERVIGLMEKEKLWLRMHDAYAAAAMEYNGVGDWSSASKMADKSLDWGEICRKERKLDGDSVGHEEDAGLDNRTRLVGGEVAVDKKAWVNLEDDTYLDMMKLKQNPKSHHSWMFRRKGEAASDEQDEEVGTMDLDEDEEEWEGEEEEEESEEL